MNRWFSLAVFAVLLLWLAPLHASSCRKPSAPWPAVRPLDVTYRFADGHQAVVWLPIFSEDGKSAYYLQCVSTWGWVPRLPIERYDYDPSGDFDCHLESAIDEDCAVEPLLHDKSLAGETDWSTRGRFFVREVIGECASYPDFGATREFLLRRMRITLQMEKIETRLAPSPTGERSSFRSFDFRVRVVSDASAQQPTAAPSKYLPPRSFAIADANRSAQCNKPTLRGVRR